MVSILERFAYTRDMSVALPGSNHVFPTRDLFKRTFVKKSPVPMYGRKYYDMLTNHARYYRPEMDAVVPNATYLTIIRHPVNQLESAFGFFEWDESVISFNKKNDEKFSLFMQNPQKYVDKKIYYWWQIHNGQLFDLGMSTHDTTDDAKVQTKIHALSAEFDLVAISEYFDESLLVLRKMMGWTQEDILYISNNIRNDKKRSVITDDVRKKILAWNKADVDLYEHFNKALWQKISAYGPSFERDLQDFRTERKRVMNACITPTSTINTDRRETRYKLKSNASDLCIHLWRGDVTYTKFLRNKQEEGRIFC
ncbi:galactosylceramide sulfotransferase-like isoform X2 [Glandiceps talaboti]